MPTYQFNSDLPVADIADYIETGAGALEDQCFPAGDRYAKYLRDIAEALRDIDMAHEEALAEDLKRR